MAWGASAALFSIPGLGEAQLALGVLTSRWTWRALAGVVVAGMLWYAHHRGYEAGANTEDAKQAIQEAARQKAVAEKAVADAATVKAALDEETKTADADADEIERLQARVAKMPATKTCPPVLLDTIRGLGR